MQQGDEAAVLYSAKKIGTEAHVVLVLHITVLYPPYWLLYLLHSPIPFCPLTNNMLQPPTSPTWLKKPTRHNLL